MCVCVCSSKIPAKLVVDEYIMFPVKKKKMLERKQLLKSRVYYLEIKFLLLFLFFGALLWIHLKFKLID